LLRRVLAGIVALPVLGAVVLGVEVELARRGPDLPDDEPLALDRIYSGGQGRALRVVWLGDSTAAGVGASGVSSSLAAQVANRLGPTVDLRGLAVSGARVSDVLDDQLGDVAALRPDRVFISVGANDTVHLTSVATFHKRYRRLVQGLPEGAEVVLLGIPDMGAPRRMAQPLRAVAGWRGRRLDRVVREVARETDSTYVDIAGATGPAFRHDPNRYFAADRYHPSDDGYRLWADAIIAEVGGRA
jgi:lysophospholipase L1-like esterase